MPVTSCTVPRTPAVTELKAVTRPALSQIDGSSGGQAGSAFFRLRRKRFPGGRSHRARASAKEAHRQEQAKAKLRRAGRRTTTNRQTGTCSTRTAAGLSVTGTSMESTESVGIMCIAALRSCLSSSVPCISCTFLLCLFRWLLLLLLGCEHMEQATSPSTGFAREMASTRHIGCATAKSRSATPAVFVSVC